MAGFVSLEGTLVANVSQTLNLKTLLGQPCGSLAYNNDDPSATHRLVTNGQTVSCKAGEQVVLTGLENYDTVVIGGNAGSTGAFRVRASTDLAAPVINPANGGPVVTASIEDGAVTAAKLEPLASAGGTFAARELIAVYDPSSNASERTVGDHLFGDTLPDNAIITYAWFDVVTPPSSAGAATLALGVDTDDPSGIKAASVIAAPPWSLAGAHDGIPDNASANFTTQTTAAGRQLVATVAAAALTAGKVIVHAHYTVGA